MPVVSKHCHHPFQVQVPVRSVLSNNRTNQMIVQSNLTATSFLNHNKVKHTVTTNSKYFSTSNSISASASNRNPRSNCCYTFPGPVPCGTSSSISTSSLSFSSSSSSSSSWLSPLPSTPTPDFPNEPTFPIVKTSIPGLKTKDLYKQMDERQEARTTHFFADFKRSVGNYIADADGNVLLDVFCQIASIPLGYNNPALITAAKSDEWVMAAINRPALGINPDVSWPTKLNDIFMSVAPKGLSQVTTLMCGSCANEVAYKAAFMKYQETKRLKEGKLSGEPITFTQEELSSCMKNQAPGSPNLSILSFEGGFHGRTFGVLSTTRSKDIHKVDIPAFDWPCAPFPKLRYPLDKYAEENRKEEDRCLQKVEEIISTFHNPVAGIVVEPVQAEGGDNHATPYFFKQLRNITLKHGVAFIVDEVQTGGGPTGNFWAHEAWGLEVPPDAVTFSKKLQAAGFFHNPDMRPNVGYRNFNTWLGDPLRALQLEVIAKQIKTQHLLENVRITGKYMIDHLIKLSHEFPSLLQNPRGVGTFLAFDLPSTKVRDLLVTNMRQKGIQSSGCGTQSIRLRPGLIFQPKHAAIYLNTLRNTLNEIQAAHIK